MQLSIIIVSYNVKYFLEQCLASVKNAIDGLHAEVYVVDNNSNDETVEYLQPKYPFVKFIQTGSNPGFAKANNLALRSCTGEYVLFLNPDTLITEDILKECLSFFSAHNDAGALGVHMLDGSGKFLPESKRAFPSPSVSFCKLTGLAAVFPTSSIFNKYALGHLNKNEVHEVDVLSGAFLMAKRHLLQQINGFDENFFMYGEDIDLSYRLQKTGFKNYYLGNLQIVHFKGESIGSEKLKHTRSFYSAMHVFVDKYYKGLSSILLKLLMKFGIFFRYILSFLALCFKRFTKNNTVTPGKKFCLIGDEISTAEAENILRLAYKDAQIEKVKSLHSGNNLSHIIFCTGELTLTHILKRISTDTNKKSYMWHAAGTRSIVGSADKNNSGNVYALDEKQILINAE